MKKQVVVTLDEKDVRDAIHEKAKSIVTDPIGGVEVEFIFGESEDVIGATVTFNGTK